MVNPMVSPGLLRLLVLAAGAFASTITSPIYMFNDPAIVDADDEGTKLLTEMQKFADSIIVVDSTSDLIALLGTDALRGSQLVVPEQEAGSLSTALGSGYRSHLGQDIQAGLHLIVHYSVDLINDITGWSMSTTGCSSSASRSLSGGGFGDGPSSLPTANAVNCVTGSTLPSAVDGFYDESSSMVYAWTAPYASGRITYMAPDYHEVKTEWPELLKSSLAANSISTSSSSSSSSSSTTSSTATSSSTRSSTSTSSTSTSSTATSTSTTTSTATSSSTRSTTSTSSTATSSIATSTSPTASTTTTSVSASTSTTSSSTTTATRTSSTGTTSTATVSSTSATTTTKTRTKIPDGGITVEQIEVLEEQRKEEATKAVAEAEASEDNAVQRALDSLDSLLAQNSSVPATPGLLGQVSIESPSGPVEVAALSWRALADADGPAEISAGANTGASLEISLGVLGEVAEAAGGDTVLLSIAGLNEDAASSLATDDVRAEPAEPAEPGAAGARRLASALRSQAISINFRSANGTKINVENLTTPMKMRLKVEDPNATCAYWDKSAAQWSSEGVKTLSSEESGFIECSTTHLSLFAGVLEVALRNVLLAVDCSTLGLLIQLEALEKLIDGEWFGRPSAWMPALMVVVFGILLVVAAWLDAYHLNDELPLEEREALLLRRGLPEKGPIRRGCTFMIDAVFRFLRWLRGTAEWVLQAICQRALELLVFARCSFKELLTDYVVDYSIGLLQAHRSATDQDTAYILQTANWVPVPDRGPAPSNENADDANRGSRTTETSGLETGPGEMPVQRARTTRRRASIGDTMRTFNAPLTSLEKARAMKRQLEHSGAVAATQFLAGNCLKRVELLFPAVHGWFALNQFSIARSYVMRVALLSMKVFSGCALDAILFSSSAEPGFNDEKPECSQPFASWEYLGQAVTTGLVSTLVSDVIIWILSFILSATIEERPAWTTKDRSARRRWLMKRILCFLCFAALYDLACLIYVYLFIANAREGDSLQLMLAIIWGLIQDGIGKPLLMAAIVAIVSSLALWIFPEVRGEVENKWVAPAQDAPEVSTAVLDDPIQPPPSPSQDAEDAPESDPATLLLTSSSQDVEDGPESDPAILDDPIQPPASPSQDAEVAASGCHSAKSVAEDAPEVSTAARPVPPASQTLEDGPGSDPAVLDDPIQPPPSPSQNAEDAPESDPAVLHDPIQPLPSPSQDAEVSGKHSSSDEVAASGCHSAKSVAQAAEDDERIIEEIEEEMRQLAKLKKARRSDEESEVQFYDILPGMPD